MTTEERQLFLLASKRQFIAILLTVSLVTAALLGHAITTLSTPLIALNLAFTLKIAVSLAPFASNPKRFGILHPLVFPALWSFAMDATRKVGVLVNGLSGHQQLTVSADDATYLMAYHELLSAVGFACIIFGFFALPKIRLPFTLPTRTPNLFGKAFILSSLSFLAFALWIKAHGSLAALILMRAMPKEERLTETIGGHYIIGTQVFGLVLLTLLAYRPKLFRNLLFWAALVFAMGMIFAATGSRSLAIYTGILACIIYTLRTQKVPYLLLVSGALASVMLLGALQVFRVSQYGRSEVNLETISELSITEAIEEGGEHAASRVADNSGSLPILSEVPHNEPLLWGQSYIALLAAPVPQALLPFQKPPTMGALNGKRFFNTAAGVPPGPIAEAYWNFHIPGIILVFTFWGIALKTLYSIVVANHKNGGIIVIYTMLIFHGNPGGDSLFTLIQTIVLLLMIVATFQLPRILEFPSKLHLRKPA